MPVIASGYRYIPYLAEMTRMSQGGWYREAKLRPIMGRSFFVLVGNEKWKKISSKWGDKNGD